MREKIQQPMAMQQARTEIPEDCIRRFSTLNAIERSMVQLQKTVGNQAVEQIIHDKSEKSPVPAAGNHQRVNRC